MTDQTVAGQIGQIARNAPGRGDQGASEQDIALAAQSSAGLGVTEADLDAIRKQLASFQKQLNEQAAASHKASPDDLTGSVASLAHYIEGLADQALTELVAAAAEAAKAAAGGGNTGALSGVVGKLEKYLAAHPPYPGENFHYNNALAIARHLPDVIERVAPRDDAEVPPGKVLQGSVVG